MWPTPWDECTPLRKSRILGFVAAPWLERPLYLSGGFPVFCVTCPLVRGGVVKKPSSSDMRGRADMTNKPESRRTCPPDFFTVEEAAAILRLGRTSAYREARKYFATGGREGMCAHRFGKQIRVPRYYVEQRLGGPITWPILTDDTAVASPVASITPAPSATRTTRRPTRPPDQDTLPFPA